jgi:hypothetical protein
MPAHVMARGLVSEVAWRTSAAARRHPVDIRPDPTVGIVEWDSDCVESVDLQLAQDVKASALATRTLKQECAAGHRQLVQAVEPRRVAVGCVVALRKLAGHLVW